MSLIKDEFFETAPATKPPLTDAEIAIATLENISLSNTVVVDDIARIILDLRKQESTRENIFLANKEAKSLAASKRNELLSMINETRLSPTISRDTQLAHLKGLLLDFELGVDRPGLDAKIVPKLIEMINKMMGYEAPIQHEVKSEQKILVFPVTSESFRGELPPLDLQTMRPVDATLVEDVQPTQHTSRKAAQIPAQSTPVSQTCPNPQPEFTSSSLEIS